MSKARARRKPPVKVFAALGDPTRLRLLSRLSDGDRCSITELTGGLSLSRQAVTKHLQVLSDAGLVQSKRVGRTNQFSLRPKALVQAEDYLAQVSSQWNQAIARLRAAVEE